MSASRKAEIRSLTGLRGVAAVFVVLFHYLASQHYGGPVTNLLLHGYLAVDLFFVLSGFVMALSYTHLFARGFSFGAYGKFLGRRIARVYPLYLVGTLCGFALVFSGWLPFKHSGSLRVLLTQNLLMVETWGFNASLDPPGWSISSEWAAYLLFPLLLVPTLSRRGWVRGLAGLLAVAVLAALCVLSPTLIHRPPVESLLNLPDPTYGFPVIRCVAEFLLGLLTFGAIESPMGRAFATVSWASSAILGCIVVLLCIPRTDFAVALLFPPLILSLSAGRTLPVRLLETGPIQYLGRISYSLYLVHGFFDIPVNAAAIAMSRHGLPHTQTLATAFGLLLSLGIATLAYHLVEVPGRHWVRRLLEGERAERPAAIAADLRPEPGEF